MKTTIWLVSRSVGFILLAAGIATSSNAGTRQSAPHHGGAAPHASAPPHHGGTAPRASAPPHHGGTATRTAPPRGYVPPRATAHGVARWGYGYGYGYGNGYGYGYGYPWWGVGYGWWGAGWYGDWWGWPGYGYAAYAPWYGSWYAPYPDSYVVPVEAPPPRGPAIVETGVSPSKAVVVLDGENVGFASDYNGRWDKLTVAPGQHAIAFQQKGYRTLVIAFEARPGATYVFNDALVPGEGEDHRTLPADVVAAPPQPREPSPAPTATGRLRVHAEPADAAVYLDGEYLALGVELDRIHGALAVTTGTHRLEAVRPGFVSAVRTVEVGGADLATVELTLEPVR